MRNKLTWVFVFFVLAAALVALFLNFAFADLLSALHIEDKHLLGDRFTLSTALALLVAVSAAVYAGLLNRRSREFIEQCFAEFNKVAWPTWSETKMNTVTVIVTSVVASVILGLFDTVFSWLTMNNLFLR